MQEHYSRLQLKHKTYGRFKVRSLLPYAGGLAMMASALKGTPESISGSLQAGSNEYIISFIWFRWTDISEGPDGKKPLFFTMSAH